MIKVFLALLVLLFSATTPVMAQTDTTHSSDVKESTSNETTEPGNSSLKTSDEPKSIDTQFSNVSPEQQKNQKEYFFLVVEGKGMPVKEILVNGINVLGGSVISLSMPINVTPMIKHGLNEIKVRCVSHNEDGLVTIMEKRTLGPKKLEVVRMALPPNESNGKEIVKQLAFNVDPAPVLPQKIELTEDDREKILDLVLRYYTALKTKNPAKLRSLYSSALREEHRIFPEGADFFEKVLNKEIALLKRKDIQMNAFSIDNIMLEQENDKIKALRKDRKAMMESNEIEVDVEPFFCEVTPASSAGEAGKKKPKKVQKSRQSKAKSSVAKTEDLEEGDKLESSAKQRLLTTTLLFRRIGGQWHLALPRGV